MNGGGSGTSILMWEKRKQKFDENGMKMKHKEKERNLSSFSLDSLKRVALIVVMFFADKEEQK